MRSRPGTIHTYVIYELFGIPPERWLECIPLQSAANFEERAQIDRFLQCRRSRD